VRERLGALARGAHEQCGGRAVAVDNLHVTLFFLGNVDDARVPALHVLGTTMRGNPFELQIDSLGYWRHNRIVWAGTKRCPAALEALAGSLRDALRTLGFEEEDRPYVPHVTLVRNARRAPAGISWTPSAWSVADFALIESVPTRRGTRYDVIARWPLVV
jgi:2'-5' RNA ligase